MRRKYIPHPVSASSATATRLCGASPTQKALLAFSGSFLSFSLNVFVVKIGTLEGVPNKKLVSCTVVTSKSAASLIADTDVALSTRTVVFLGLGGSVQPGGSSLSTTVALLTIRLSPAGAHRHTLVPAAATACVCALRSPLYWLKPLQFSGMWSAAALHQMLQACGTTKYHFFF